MIEKLVPFNRILFYNVYDGRLFVAGLTSLCVCVCRPLSHSPALSVLL